MAAILAFVVILAAENAGIYLYWRNRKGIAPAAPPHAPGAGTAPAPTPRPPPPMPQAPAQEALPEARAEPVPPEALPVGDDEPVETVDMK